MAFQCGAEFRNLGHSRIVTIHHQPPFLPSHEGFPAIFALTSRFALYRDLTTPGPLCLEKTKSKTTIWLTVLWHVFFLCFFFHDHFGGEISLITDAANVKDAIGQSVPSFRAFSSAALSRPSQKQKVVLFEERAFVCRRTPPPPLPSSLKPTQPLPARCSKASMEPK